MHILSVTWSDRTGSECNGCIAIASYDASQPSISLWGSVALLGFNATVSTQTGISSFIVDYNLSGGSDIGAATHATNGGSGFPFQDVVVWHRAKSCTNGQRVMIVAAVRVYGLVSPFITRLLILFFFLCGGCRSVTTWA